MLAYFFRENCWGPKRMQKIWSKIASRCLESKWSNLAEALLDLLVLGRAGQSQSTGSCPTIAAATVSAGSHCPPNPARAGLLSMHTACANASLSDVPLHLQQASCSLKTLFLLTFLFIS